MEHSLIERGFSCKPIMWAGDGPALAPQDEQHAFRYEVRDRCGELVGFINADRARQHPDVKWKRSLLREGKIEELDEEYATVQDAFAVFQE